VVDFAVSNSGATHRRALASNSFPVVQMQKGRSVAHNKDSNQKQPGEKELGKLHYDPGKMSRKSAESYEDET
jgi:hypothetical protein